MKKLARMGPETAAVPAAHAGITARRPGPAAAAIPPAP